MKGWLAYLFGGVLVSAGVAEIGLVVIFMGMIAHWKFWLAEILASGRRAPTKRTRERSLIAAPRFAYTEPQTAREKYHVAGTVGLEGQLLSHL